MVRRRAWAAIVAVVSVLGFGLTARASMVEALDLAALVQRADDVVVAQVQSANSHYDEHGRIVTDVQMRVERAEKGGNAAGSLITVRRLGGTVGDIGMRIEGEPNFDMGETVLLFGTRIGPDKLLRPVGMSQGAMRITVRDGQRWVQSAAAGAALVVRAPDGSLLKAQPAVEQPRKLDDVLTQIRSLVAKK